VLKDIRIVPTAGLRPPEFVAEHLNAVASVLVMAFMLFGSLMIGMTAVVSIRR
jgi:hypothetical protein